MRVVPTVTFQLTRRPPQWRRRSAVRLATARPRAPCSARPALAPIARPASPAAAPFRQGLTLVHFSAHHKHL